MRWPRNPTVFEINTWAWLHELSKKHEHRVTLDTVPPGELDGLRRFDAVWLMGVWERSPKGREIALRHSSLQGEQSPNVVY